MTLLSQQGSLALVQPGCWTRMALCLARLDDRWAECLNLSKTTGKVLHTFPYRADIFFRECWEMPLSGQKARLASKIQEIFQLGYPLDHLNFEQKNLEIQMYFSFQCLQRFGLQATDLRRQFPQVMKCSPCQNKTFFFFFHRWLAGNLDSRCWVIRSHKSANPAFLPVHSCFTITMMSAEPECD